MKNLYFVFIVLILGGCTPSHEKTSETVKVADFETLYVGTYTKKEGHVDGKAQGIYKLQMNKETGELMVIDTILNTVNPSYIAIHPNKKYLYAVNEIADGNRIGTITAYNIENETITEIAKISSEGDAPCHISVDKSGQYVLVANYMEVMVVYKIKENGSLEWRTDVAYKRLKPQEFRQETGHPHMVLPAFDSSSIFVADLGGDLVYHYQIIENGNLKRYKDIETAPKSGPRHLDAHPNQPWLYVLNELNSTIEGYYYNKERKTKDHFQTISTLKTVDKNVNPSAIHIHPSGKFLYAANRGINDGKENSIAAFSVNPQNGKLTLLEIESSKGLVPRDFTISPNGEFLLVANQNSNTIVTFKINQNTGMLEATANVLEISTPVCLKFL
jgi:6-phosphogluconolactonase